MTEHYKAGLKGATRALKQYGNTLNALGGGDLEQDIRADERKAVLAIVEGWLVDRPVNYEQARSAITLINHGFNCCNAELRAKLAEMEGGK